MSFPSIRLPVAVDPSIWIPHWLAEITFMRRRRRSADRVAEGPLDQDPLFELPRSAVPDLSVPIRLPSIRFLRRCRAVDLDSRPGCPRSPGHA